MEWIAAIVIGLLAGIVAKLLMPGKDPGGFIITAILGIVGAIVATWLGEAIGWYREGEAAGFVGAVVGAIVLLTIYRVVRGRTASLGACATAGTILRAGCLGCEHLNGALTTPPAISRLSPFPRRQVNDSNPLPVRRASRRRSLRA